MDLSLRIIHARDFLEVTPAGEIELGKSKQSLLNLASFSDFEDAINWLTSSTELTSGSAAEAG
jgi:hypothetical protein